MPDVLLVDGDALHVGQTRSRGLDGSFGPSLAVASRRVALVAYSFPPDGAASVERTRQLAHAVQTQGVRATVIWSSSSGAP